MITLHYLNFANATFTEKGTEKPMDYDCTLFIAIHDIKTSSQCLKNE